MSDFDRNKYYGKKKILAGKENGSNYGRSYGRRSPNSEPRHSNEIPKQPTILIKPREHQETELTAVTSSPKKAVRDQEPSVVLAAPSATNYEENLKIIIERYRQVFKLDQNHAGEEISISLNSSGNRVLFYAETRSEPYQAASSAHPQDVKPMTRSVKFLEDSILATENLLDYVQENSDFLVVGVVGPQGSGKSTVLNLLAHSCVTEELKRALFKLRHSELPKDEEEYGDKIKPLNLAGEFKPGELRNEIFRLQSGEDVENNCCATRGIDAFISSNNRTIFLDCQPFNSTSLLDDLMHSENKRSNLVSEFIPLENSGEIQGLQLVAFLMSVCHVLIVVQDWFLDSNVVRFIQTAEMLKPTHSNPEDDLIDHFPHLLMVQNRAQMEDFFPEKFRKIQGLYSMLFRKTKLQTDTLLGLASSKLISNLDEETCGDPFNVFLVPEYKESASLVYRGHPTLENIIKRLRANILGSARNPLTHVQLTEKTWLTYCSKVWDNVKKSSFFVEYTKLMP